MAAVLTVSLLVLFAAILLLGGTAVASRGLYNRQVTRTARRIAPIRPLLMRLAADDDEAGYALTRLSALDDRQWRAIEPNAVALLVKVKGAARQSLVELFARRGTVDRARRDLRRLGAVRRAKAIETLGILEEQDSFPSVCEALHDRVPEVRLVAARALGRLRNPEAAGPLLRSLVGGRNPAGTVAKALVRIGPSAGPALGAALGDDDPLVRATAAQVLGLIGPTPAADRLIPMLEKESYPEVRTMVVQSLGMLGTRAALEALRRAAGSPRSEPGLRAEVALALGEIGAVAAVPELRALVSDPHHRVAHQAAAAMARLGDTGERELMAISTGSDGTAAAHAEEALTVIRLSRDRDAARSARLTGRPAASDPAADRAPTPRGPGRRVFRFGRRVLRLGR